MLTQVIGIDLGGTAIKLGRFTSDGSCLKSLSVHTPQPATPEAVVAAIVDAIARVDPEGNAVAIGVGTPGPADAQGRIAKIAINLPQWRNIPLADTLEEKIGKPTIIDNDANCAGLGEAWLGAGRFYKNFILLTLGTGVGGAIFIDGKLFTGKFGAAGELGLISVNPNGSQCKSGNRGSLEQHTSVIAIRRRSGKEPAELGTLAKTGNKEALKFWQEYGKDLGIGVTSLIYVLTPEAVVIGGGVSASFEFFLPSMKAEIEQRVMPTSRVNLQIVRAHLGNGAGMLGAAKLAIEKFINN
ncbi:transcriptional regulator/sugar kinase [Rivularia sp. PCC 7116]|uniref:ROK family protein n=1 Tax=Rivularia sp. PCC 7116 TaxID=373994 RepID=UPI00029EE9A4|nr:ROK family protein [Rivularia sp. PCC 7116]AFY56291.1 transcriptional regulator/sugar kinase [Rivularia sp. PCC 7116]